MTGRGRQAAALALGMATLLAVEAAAPRAGGATASPAPPAPTARVHVVARGDTLSGIARRYRVTVAALVAANRLASERALLRPGQRLSVPSPTAPRGATRAPAPPRPRAAASAAGPASLVLAVPDLDDLLELAWPLAGPVSSTFGRRRSGWHRGIDIKADRGTQIRASADGVVTASGVEARYGRVVKLAHERGVVTVYAHNERNLVRVGDRVAAGDVIATVGRSGRATSFHLHFEVRQDSHVYNPLYLLPLPPRLAQVDESEDTGEGHD